MTTKLRESGARVLVVDDSEEMRSALRRMLAPLASEICEARNGIELMAAVAGDVMFVLIAANCACPDLTAWARRRPSGDRVSRPP